MLLRILCVAILLSTMLSVSCSSESGSIEKDASGAPDEVRSLEVFRDCLRKCGFKKELIATKDPHLEIAKCLLDLNFEAIGFSGLAYTLRGGADRLDNRYNTLNLTANWGQHANAKDYWTYCRTYLYVDRFTPERFRQAKKSLQFTTVYRTGDGKNPMHQHIDLGGDINASVILYAPPVGEILSIEFTYRTTRSGKLPDEEQMRTLLREIIKRLDQCLVQFQSGDAIRAIRGRNTDKMPVSPNMNGKIR
jgi:hypothetical protein